MPTAYARASVEELEPFIQSCGLYRAKAKNIIAAARALVDEHGGEVPRSRAALEELPGVGRKTAGVVCIHLGGDDAFPVDTHVKRLAYRLGFSRHEDPDKVERDMQALLPPERWAKGHQLLVWHGRRTCFARAPACERCPVADLCPKKGVRTRPTAGPRARLDALHPLADELALERGDMVHEDGAIEVVRLVLHRDGQQPVARQRLLAALGVQELHRHHRGPVHVLGLAGDGQAALGVGRLRPPAR